MPVWSGTYLYSMKRQIPFFDYLDPKDITIKSNNLAASAQNYWDETEGRFKLYAYDTDRPILSPEDLLLRPDIFFNLLIAILS